jgi:hypothetical protein
VGDDMAASVGGGGINGRSPGCPKCGQSPRAPDGSVAVQSGGGGGERKGWDGHNM